MPSPQQIEAGFILVVAAAIRDDAGRLLLQERLPGKHHAGLWEFPGGKVDQGEEPRQALCRELAEELGLALEPPLLRPVGFADEPAEPGRRALVLLLFEAEAAGGEPRALDGQRIGWFTRPEAASLPLAPLDRMLLPCLAD